MTGAPAMEQDSRRGFLGRLTVLAGAVPFLGALVAALRTLLSPSPRSGAADVAVCRAAEVPATGLAARTVRFRRRLGAFTEEAELLVYLLREARGDPESRIVALSGECTHLGCPVHPDQDREKLLCPCHGGVFARDGRVLSGPPPADLLRYQVLPAGDDGMVRIRIPG